MTRERVWTYGEAAAEVESRRFDEPTVFGPSLDADSVFTVLAGLSGEGIAVVAPGQEVPAPPPREMVVYTSGTTGPPKGVRLTLDNLSAAAEASKLHLGHGEDDVWLLAMPLHHVAGLSIVVRQAHAGGSVRLLDGFDVAEFADSLKDDVTMASVVPTMLARLLPLGPYTGLRAVLVGGGPIPSGLLEEAAAVGLPVLPTYGMTETFGQVATLLPGSPLDYRAHPLPGVDLRINADGLVEVRGRVVSPGYVGEPDRDDDWFVTSDLGEIDAEGAVRILGRADDVIVTGGENVNPRRVEARVEDHPSVEESVVFGVPDDEWGMRVVCAYVGDEDPAVLGGWCADALPGFMVPKRFIRLESIPRLSIGKPDKEALVDLCLGGGD